MRASRSIHAAISALAIMTTVPALAAPAEFPLSRIFTSLSGNLPDGWGRNMDGTFKQSASGVLCPKTFQSFDFQRLIGPDPATPNVLGTCLYSDGAGRTGAIRIRSYLEGWGDDQAMSTNDKLLMATDGSAPPMLMRAGISRKTGGGRLTVTVDKSGYLVDCSVTQLSHETPDRAFALYCSTLTGS
jgi:hypothetical protein